MGKWAGSMALYSHEQGFVSFRIIPGGGGGGGGRREEGKHIHALVRGKICDLTMSTFA